MAAGIGVCGTVYGGICSRGKPMKPACTGAAVASGGGAAPRAGTAAVFVWVAGGTAAGAAGVNVAFCAWCAIQLANCSGVTVNALKRMFACDVPQYSAQKPLNASPFASTESGVIQR